MEHYIDKAMRLAGTPVGTVVVPVCIKAPHNNENPIPPEATFDGILTQECNITASFTDNVKEGRFYLVEYPFSGYGDFRSDKGRVLLWRIDRLSNVPDGWIWAGPPGLEWRDRKNCVHPHVISVDCHSMERFDGLFDPWVWVLYVSHKQ